MFASLLAGLGGAGAGAGAEAATFGATQGLGGIEGGSGIDNPQMQDFLRQLLGGSGGQNLFSGGAGGTSSGGAGVGSSGGGGGDILSKLFGAVPGAIGGGADLLSQILNRKNLQRGNQDIQEGLQQGLGGEQEALKTALAGFQPFEQAGSAAVGQEQRMLSAGEDPTAQVSKILDAFNQSPAQKATINAGMDAVQNRLQAQGLGQSGAEQKALEQFGQQGTAGQAQQFLQSVLGARGQTLGGLQGLGGLGLGAAGQAGQLGVSGSQGIADLLSQIGQTKAAGEQQKASSRSGIIGSAASILQSIL